jgi:opacity protein-like surface antigen
MTMWEKDRPLVILLSFVFGLFPLSAFAQSEQTPEAGKEFHTTLFGEKIYVPSRDRRSVTAANFGLHWIPNGPSEREILPFGALYVWRNWDKDNRRFRGVFSGAVNRIDYTIGLRTFPNWSLIFTLDNFIVPLGQSEYVEGQRISESEIEWNYVFGGFGVGYRFPFIPFEQDSAINVSLTYEPGYRWFRRTKDTSPRYGVPNDTYEGRIHGRIRWDGMVRNLMELPHRGFSVGGDVIHGHRAQWDEWGGAPFDQPDFKKEQTYISASAYAVFASGLPAIESDKHRLITTVHGGIGKDLDRFSAFRLPGRPTGFEWEALSLPTMPGVQFNELFPRRYAIASVTYRYEALFFLYPYVTATYGLVERPRFTSEGIRNTTDSLPALGGGLVTGAPWKSQIELNYSYNFGIFRDPGGAPPTRGGHGVFIFWAKEL